MHSETATKSFCPTHPIQALPRYALCRRMELFTPPQSGLDLRNRERAGLAPRISIAMKIARAVLVRIPIYGGIWLALCAVIGIVAAEGALHPARLALEPDSGATAQSFAARNRATLADVAIPAGDGVVLRAWSLRPATGNGDSVIVLHGQAANREVMFGTAGLLLRHGYSVLLPDARDHGASGGAIATYGILESADLRRWVDWIEHAQAPHCIYGLGDSMGAAQLLQSLAAIPEFCAVVAESTFSSFREAAYDRIGQQFRTGPWLGRTVLRPAIEEGLIYARFQYGVDLAKASPERVVASTRVPVLLIHGLADTNLPPRHSERINAKNPNVVLWEPPGAGHCGASDAAPEEYERRVIGWFESHSHRS
jgi:uncharacterized protein